MYAIVRLLHSHWNRVCLYLFGVWHQLLHFANNAGAKAPETDIIKGNTPEIDDREAGPFEPLESEFPATTDEQSNFARRVFIDSLDTTAVCALASQHYNGKACRVVKKDSGSFNVCFFVEFYQDGPKWIVRIPIEPALDNPWDKLLSEVATIQYLERNTRIPVPHIRAYGNNAHLTSNGARTQSFLITDLIPGEALNKKALLTAELEQKRAFYSQLISIFVELRKLQFPLIGSLMPDPNGRPDPVLGSVMSMSAATLRSHPQPTFSSAKDYMRNQFRLVSGFFSPPVAEHTVDDLKREVFALHGMERIFHQVIDSQLDEGPFVLNHLDLRSSNIIVDNNLQIQGIIDWEFASTVPRQVLTPPSWITGHDSMETDRQMHTDFRQVLDEKSKTNRLCNQLKEEWYGLSGASESGISQTDMVFCVAHVLRRPTDLTDIFCDFLVPRLYEKPLDDVISEFFDQHETLMLEVQRRAEHCERYTQYLKEQGLYETELGKLLAESKALKEKWNWS